MAELIEKLGARFGKAHVACFYEGKVELAEEEGGEGWKTRNQKAP